MSVVRLHAHEGLQAAPQGEPGVSAGEGVASIDRRRAMTPETTLPPVTLPDDTRKDLTQAGKQVKVWTAKRDDLIRAAVEAGGSLREVGEAVGMSHTAVKFIAHGRP